MEQRTLITKYLLPKLKKQKRTNMTMTTMTKVHRDGFHWVWDNDNNSSHYQL
jgi:hypothetical protein